MEELKKEMDVIQTGGGPEKEQPAFECRKLTMRYGKTLALDAVDLTLMPGRIVGLLGPNGSGKTTMIKLANVREMRQARSQSRLSPICQTEISCRPT